MKKLTTLAGSIALLLIITVIFFDIEESQQNIEKSEMPLLHNGIVEVKADAIETDQSPVNHSINKPDQTGDASVAQVNHQSVDAGDNSNNNREPEYHSEHIIVYPDEIDPVQSVSPDGAYYISVNNIYIDDAVEFPAEDYQRITLTTSLGNQSGALVDIKADALALIDRDGNYYRPSPVVDLSPNLIDTDLYIGETVVGFVSFEIPAETTADILELCINDFHPCVQPLQARLP